METDEGRVEYLRFQTVDRYDVMLATVWDQPQTQQTGLQTLGQT